MIGQLKLLDKIDRMLDTGFPRFTIIVGGMRSGKRMLAKHIANRLGAHFIESEIKVDNVREIIDLAYKQTQPTLYLLPDTDKMSIAAKNALLKITEEPPKRAYFIMTLKDLNNTLPTLTSRGTVLKLDPYTPEDLAEYCRLNGYHFTEKDTEIVLSVCTTPGEVDILTSYNIQEFNNYVETVMDNIGKVNGANAFKIGLKLKFKEDGEGYEVALFMNAIMMSSVNRIKQTKDRRYLETIKTTSKHLSQMNLTGVNKSSTFDMWILQMRGIWVE